MNLRPALPVAAGGLLASSLPALAEPFGAQIGALATTLSSTAADHIRDLAAAMARAPAEGRQIVTGLAAALNSGSSVRSVTFAAILMIVGGGLEWLYWTYAAAPLRAVVTTPAHSARAALGLAGLRAAYLCFGLALFFGGTLLVAALLPWPPNVGTLAADAALLVVAVRLAAMLAGIVVSPHHRQLRLAAISPARSRWVVAGVAWLAALLASAVLLPDVLTTVGHTPAFALVVRVALATLLALSIIVVAITMRNDIKGPRLEEARWRRPRFPRAFLSVGAVLVTYAAWLVGAGAFAALVADLCIAAALLLGARRAVFFIELDHGADSQGPESAGVGALLVLSTVRFAIVVTAIAVGAFALGLSATTLGSDRDPWSRLTLHLLLVAALGFATRLAWIALRASIDARLDRIGPPGEHAEPGPNTRLLTLLPLLRMTGATVFAALFALSALYILDIPIAPLLAGAGVFGLAIGFGAQALVRDVISGVFYLAEDVFRVGEYIESGSSTKGTVERITLRTVALRHQNGPIHFVPYGSLGTVRNTSRDWVVDKFNIPLPVTVDSEQVRKLIKKVGEAMSNDPQIGPLLHAPLKAKLYRIDPGIKLFRCKFQTAPGRQFEIRVDAYKRIEAALASAGIRFADTQQTLVVRESKELV